MELLRGIVATALALILLGAAAFFSFFVLVAALAVAVPVGLAVFFYTKHKLRQAEGQMTAFHREQMFDDATGVVHDVKEIDVVIEDRQHRASTRK